MRKTVTTRPRETEPAAGTWLELADLIDVEVTSEDPAHPVESALLGGAGGWLADGPGPQMLRLTFHEPQAIRKVRLEFSEPVHSRHQEFVLSWSNQPSGPMREIVRQQYHFSPQGATRQVEQYELDLAAVRVLQLEIIPETSGGNVRASLSQMQVAGAPSYPIT